MGDDDQWVLLHNYTLYVPGESLKEEEDFLGVICATEYAFDYTLVCFDLVFGKKSLCNQKEN